ncbi:MAG: carboxy terminal-processing peptidase [Bacteroidia bacterium]
MNMKIKMLPLAGILAATMLFGSWTFSLSDDKNSLVAKLLIQGLSSSHYTSVSINDDFSEQAFDLYLQRLDFSKRYLTQKDVEELNAHRDQLDDQMKVGSYEMYERSVELYKKRTKEVEGYVDTYLKKPFDFNRNEQVNLDAESTGYATDSKELKDRWRKLLKYQTLARYVNLLNDQKSKVKKGELESVDSDAVLEEKAREGVRKSYNRVFRRMHNQTDKDYRSRYLNAVTSTFDPHTNYYAPKDKKDFDEKFTGQYEGIGARLLEQDNGYIKITEVIPGGPAARQGELRAEDEIVKVAQGDGEPVDVVNTPINDAIKLIKGKKGTTVNLTVKRGTEMVVIPIERDVVVIEETYAKSVLISDEKGGQYGYIRLPSFYADFKDPNGPSCSRDVGRELEKLKDHNVKGIVLDLRNNGGGSLYDAVKMAGFFIKEGPVVQVKSRGRSPYVMKDEDPRVQYDGNLVILVNEFSASASEILAAAMQDYKRAVILGSPSTFGKGTVQRFVDLDRFVEGSENLKPLGSVKLTTQKFYRINGGATQLKGVIPDVVLPDVYAYLEMGEKERDHALEWDEIAPADYKSWVSTGAFYKKAIQRSQKRVDNNVTFQQMDQNAVRFKKQRDLDVFPLGFKAYSELRASQKTEADKYKDIMKEIPAFDITSMAEDLAKIEQDSVRMKENDKWHKNLRKDPYVFEAMQVLKDLR